MPYRPNRISNGIPYPVFDFRDAGVDHQPHIVTQAHLNNNGVLQDTARTRDIHIIDPAATPIGHTQFAGKHTAILAGTYYGLGSAIHSGAKPHYLEIDACLNVREGSRYAQLVIGYTDDTLAINASVTLDSYFPLGLTSEGTRSFSCQKTIIQDSASSVMILAWLLAGSSAGALTYDGRISWRRYEEDLDVFDPNR